MQKTENRIMKKGHFLNFTTSYWSCLRTSPVLENNLSSIDTVVHPKIYEQRLEK